MRPATFLALLMLAGCGVESKRDPKAAKHDDDGGHSHERGKMLLADAGKYHAALTAHLSPKGNELDIFFETGDDPPKPVAIPLTKLTAYAPRIGEGEPKELIFEPAPADERPKDEKAGTCSHFVAKAPWMRADEALTVTLKVEIDGREVSVKWDNFVPKKYAHPDE